HRGGRSGARFRFTRYGAAAGARSSLTAAPSPSPPCAPSHRGAPRSEALRSSIPLLVVIAATWLAFLPGLEAGFVDWDDEVLLVNNPHYRGLGWTQLRWMFTTMLLGHYVPLTWLSFGLNHVLGGMDPWGYHLGNLLLHATNAVLFFAVAR